MYIRKIFLILSLLCNPFAHAMDKVNSDNIKEIVVGGVVLGGLALLTQQYCKVKNIQQNMFINEYPGNLIFTIGIAQNPQTKSIISHSNTTLPCFGITEIGTYNPYRDITKKLTPSKWDIWWNNEKTPQRISSNPINQLLLKKNFKGTLLLMEYQKNFIGVEKHWMNVVGNKKSGVYIYIRDASKGTTLEVDAPKNFNPPGFLLITSQSLGQTEQALQTLETIKTNLESQSVQNVVNQIITHESKESAIIVHITKKTNP